MPLFKILATDEERYITINALSEEGKKLVNKEKHKIKLTRDEQKALNSIDNLVKQLAYQQEDRDIVFIKFRQEEINQLHEALESIPGEIYEECDTPCDEDKELISAINKISSRRN